MLLYIPFPAQYINFVQQYVENSITDSRTFKGFKIHILYIFLLEIKEVVIKKKVKEDSSK